jgi:hypothetical protein
VCVRLLATPAPSCALLLPNCSLLFVPGQDWTNPNTAGTWRGEIGRHFSAQDWNTVRGRAACLWRYSSGVAYRCSPSPPACLRVWIAEDEVVPIPFSYPPYPAVVRLLHAIHRAVRHAGAKPESKQLLSWAGACHGVHSGGALAQVRYCNGELACPRLKLLHPLSPVCAHLKQLRFMPSACPGARKLAACSAGWTRLWCGGCGFGCGCVCGCGGCGGCGFGYLCGRACVCAFVCVCVHMHFTVLFYPRLPWCTCAVLWRQCERCTRVLLCTVRLLLASIA